MKEFEIFKQFEYEYRSMLEDDYPNDPIAWRYAFNEYVDTLFKDGLVTQKQYANMTYPKWMK